MIYINEIDKHCCEWMSMLSMMGEIPVSYIDQRSIKDVAADDVRGFDQCHFFSGIAGWPLALQLAGWPEDRPVWTGSCPCQPFSTAGQAKGQADERHLWPEMFRLIRECKPDAIFGEQVASARGKPELSKLVRSARANRVGRLKGYGNAIVPQLAAVFIRAFMESVEL